MTARLTEGFPRIEELAPIAALDCYKLSELEAALTFAIRSPSMRICGISLDNNAATVVIIDADEHGQIVVYDTPVRKISLSDHEDAAALRDFARTVGSFIRDNAVHRIAVRRCSYKGKFTSGAAAIKMEALLQLTEIPVDLLAPQSIKALAKAVNATIPSCLKTYQHEAFLTAVAHSRQIQ